MSRRPAAVLVLAVALVAVSCGGGSKRRASAPPSTVPAAAAATIPFTTADGGSTTTTTIDPNIKVTLAFTPCGFDKTVQCATADPPIDYANPNGPKESVLVAKRPATGPSSQRIGSLFVNPGGPGASAVSLMLQIIRLTLLPPQVLSRFDLVAFDPRGVGGSNPIACETDPELDRFFALDLTPDTPAEHQALVDASRNYAVECGQRNGARIAHFDTRTTARDWDLIRQALGEDKISYIGFSYGTYLGAVYGDMFPTHVRAFVLDGAIDPTISSDEVNHQQAVGFEKELQSFFAYCANLTNCAFRSGGNPAAAFDALAARIDQSPVPTSSGRMVGPGEFEYGVIQPLYDRDAWPELADALQQAASTGKADGLLKWSDTYTHRQSNGRYNPLLSAYNAYTCIDRPWPRNVADYDAQAAHFGADAPHFGAALVYMSLPCASWPYPAVDTPHPLRAAGSAPIVVIGTTGDPATPYQWAQSLAGQLEHGVLVTYAGEGHTAFSSNNPCIKAAETAYLLNLTVPAAGTTCR